VAGAYVEEELAAGERVGDEGDAAAAVSAVGATEDVDSECALKEVGPDDGCGLTGAEAGPVSSSWFARSSSGVGWFRAWKLSLAPYLGSGLLHR